MNESVRDLLRQSADAVERPNLAVDHLVAQAEGRLRRRRLAGVATSAVAVAVIAAGGFVTLGPDDREVSPAPTPSETPSIEPAPEPGETIYFSATSSGGAALTAPDPSLSSDLDLYIGHEGGVATRIVATSKSERCPRVSPDGEWLAYVSGPREELKAADLVVVPLDASGRPEGDRRVLVRDAVGSCPQWSPDGRSLAVLAGDTTLPQAELRVVKPDGSERVLVSLPQYLIPHVAWSPDGDELAYTTEDSVFTVSATGGTPKLLWRGTSSPDTEPGGLPAPGAPQSLSWLGSGEVVVSALLRFTETGHDYVIHLLDPVSGRDQVLDEARGGAGGSWSPDGSRLAFLDGEEGPVQLYDRGTGSTTTVRPMLEGVTGLVIYDVAWSRDGSRLLVGLARNAASSGAAFALGTMAADGTDVVVHTPWTNALYWTDTDDMS